MKIAIIYRGNIRGFKYDICFSTHKKLYDELNKHNIEFDVFLCTNNYEYDDTNLIKIPNLKIKEVLKLEEIRKTNEYKSAINNITFKTSGWNSTYQNNIITYWYNNNFLFDKMKDTFKDAYNTYDKYLLMDISQIIDKINIDLFLDNKNYVSSIENCSGYNTRIIISNYNLFEKMMCQFNFIVNDKHITAHNPENFNLNYLKNINIVTTNDLRVRRIRENGIIL